MRCLIPGPLPADTTTMMRYFGYAEHHTVGMGLTFVRNAHEAAFPRFHAKVEKSIEGGFVMHVHLDQATFGGEGNHRYIWAYKNPHLDEEYKRILLALDALKRRLLRGEYIPFHAQEPAKEKLGFLGKLMRLM